MYRWTGLYPARLEFLLPQLLQGSTDVRLMAFSA